jgi:hypothetical protein
MIQSKHRNLAFLTIVFLLVGVFWVVQPVRAATNRYVVNPSHCANFPSFTPCYTSLVSAINASTAGDTIIFLENMNYGISTSDTVSNIAGLTIKGNNANGSITVPALGFALANNLTVQDLTMDVLNVINVTTKVRIQNISANGIYVLPTTDLNATLEFVNNKLPQTKTCGGFYCDLSVLGAEGKRIDGTITLQGNTAGALNVFANIAASGTAVLGANVTLDSNTITDTVNIGIRRNPGKSFTGAGNITGNITFNNNTVVNTQQGLNVTIDLNTHGTISGNVAFTNNNADKIACLTYDADAAFNNAMSGTLNVTGNTTEVIELGFKGDFTGTDLNVQNNNITYQGSSSGAVITMRANRFSSATTIRVGDNTGKTGITFDTFTGSNDATISVYRNSAYYVAYHTATGQVGAYSVSDNTISGPYPAFSNPDWGYITTITGNGAINTMNFVNNVTDKFYLNAATNVAGNILMQGNTIKGITIIAATGAAGAGKVTMNYNRFGVTTSDSVNFTRVNADVNFNAILGPLYPTSSTVNAQRNWWGCNGGPGLCFPASVPNSTPFMRFYATAVCGASNNKISVGYFLNYDSNGTAYSNISIPGNVTVSTNVGSVAAPNPKALKANFSWNSSLVNVPANATATVSATLDFQTQTISNKQCVTRTDTIGLYRNGTFLLRNSNSAGAPDITVNFGNAGWLPLAGDWNNDGVDTIGAYDPTTGVFYMRDTNTTGGADYSFVLGNPSDTPMAGRWDPSMSVYGAGVFRPSNGIIYLKRTLTSGFSDYYMVLGNPGDKGFAGDWDGDGYDGPGVFRPTQARWYLSNNGTANGIIFDDGYADYAPANNNSVLPVIGDWNADGVSGIGYFLNGVFYLRNTPTGSSAADLSFAFGAAGDLPLAGHWTSGAFVPPQVIVQPGTVGSTGTNAGDSSNGD